MLRCPQEPCPSHNRRSPRRADTHSLEAGEGGSTASATEKGCSCLQFNSYRAQRGHGFAEGSDLIRRCGQGAQPLPERLCGCSSPRRLPGPVIMSRSRRRGSAGARSDCARGPVSRRLVGLAGLRGRAGEARGRRSEDEKRLKAGSRCRPTSAHPAVGNVPFDQVPRPRQCPADLETLYKREAGTARALEPLDHVVSRAPPWEGVGRSSAPSRVAEKPNSWPSRTPSAPGEYSMTVADLSSASYVKSEAGIVEFQQVAEYEIASTLLLPEQRTAQPFSAVGPSRRCLFIDAL